MMCRICKDELDPEHPDSIWGVNPVTFRNGWMHLWCCSTAAELLVNEPASNELVYQDRYEEWLWYEDHNAPIEED